MKAMVTGGGGYIGSVLISLLLERDTRLNAGTDSFSENIYWATIREIRPRAD